MRNQVLAAAVAATVLGVVGAMWGLTRSPGEAEPGSEVARTKEPEVVRFGAGAPQLAKLAVEPVPLMPVPLGEPLNGRIVYHEDHTARISSPIAGRIVEIRAQVGDAVAAGAPLAIIDAPELGTAEADLAKARADEGRKALALQRARELYEGGVLPRKDLEAAEADHTQAAAETRRAALRLANLNPRRVPLNGQRMPLAAPVPGVLAERRATPGMEVRPDLPEPLFVVTDLRFAQVIVDLPEQHLGKLTSGLPVAVEVDAWPGMRFRGRVERIAPTVDPVTRRIQVRCSVENADGKLKPEMFARVLLLSGQDRTAVRVPNAALVTDGLNSYVFVAREPGVYVRRKVGLAVQDREYTYVASGLAAGEPVVVRGALLLNSQLASGG